jgi:hypothetical protein
MSYNKIFMSNYNHRYVQINTNFQHAKMRSLVRPTGPIIVSLLGNMGAMVGQMRTYPQTYDETPKPNPTKFAAYVKSTVLGQPKRNGTIDA